MIGQTNAVEDVNIKSSVNYVEYIESTGTQYIDTGYVATTKTKVEIDCTLPNNHAFGSATLGTQSRYYNMAIFARSQSVICCRAGLSTASGSEKDVSVTTTVRHLYSLDFEEFYVDGVLKYSFPSSVTSGFINTNSLYLFARHGASGVDSLATSMKLYACRIYENDVLIQYLKPVLDENNVACLYDEVSKTYFYNAGTGTFNAGTII